MCIRAFKKSEVINHFVDVLIPSVLESISQSSIHMSDTDKLSI